MVISTAKFMFFFAITMATLDSTSCQLAAIATRLPEIITLLENVTDLDWQQNIQTTQSQIAGSQNQTATTLTQMASTLTQMANTLNQVANLLQMQSQQLHNMTTTMTTMVSIMEKQQETLGNMSKQQGNQIMLLERPPPPISPPSDCSDISALGYTTSQTYTITPQDGMGSFTVYCDLQTAGGGWTVFQRRYDGSLDFYLGWAEYERGFGDPSSEHWLGLREIHRLTANARYTLRVDLEDFEGNVAYAEYESFRVGDAASNYVLYIGSYSGNAGDSLTYHADQPFTTHDNDNDQSSGNCAEHKQSAWWYSSCGNSNLNGQYLGPTGDSARAMFWLHWKGTQSLKSSSMKIRRVQ